MNSAASALVERIEGGLLIETAKLNCLSPARWSLQFANGARRRLEVQRDAEWLKFTSDCIPPPRPTLLGNLWDAVQKNAALPAAIKWAISPSRTLELRVDLLLSDDMDLENRIRGVVGTFESAWVNNAPLAVAPASENLDGLEQLCEEAGWPGVRRSSARLTVALDTTPALQATVASVGNGLRACVEVADISSSSSFSRNAFAALALELTSHARLVRASADVDSGRLLFETVWAVPPTTAELHAGLASLSAALRAAGESFTALQGEQLAQDYLTVRGWTADISQTNQQPERTNT